MLPFNFSQFSLIMLQQDGDTKAETNIKCRIPHAEEIRGKKRERKAPFCKRIINQIEDIFTLLTLGTSSCSALILSAILSLRS